MAKKKRGPKPFKATAARRKEVLELAAVGMSQDMIARALGCSTPTLLKHFGDDLKTGVAKKRKEVIKTLFEQARGGNVSALKHLEVMTRATVAADPATVAMNAKPSATAAAVPTSARIGKKDMAKIEAMAATQEADDEWGDDLRPPTLPN